MHFLHLGDLHLGRSLGEFDLIRDQAYALEQVLEIIDREQVDALLLAGDIYDKAIPSEAAVRLLDGFLHTLAQRAVTTFIISGNHDSDDRLRFGSALFATSRIYIAAGFDGAMQRHTLRDAHGEVDVWLLPFVKASQVRHCFPEEQIGSYEEAVAAILRRAQIRPDRRNVIVAHQFVTGGGADPLLGGSEGAAAQSVGLVEKISYTCFDAFDYAALGHIHTPQRVGRDEVRYAGSLLKYSLREADHEKSAALVTLEEKGETQIRLIPIRPMRDLRHLRGPMEKLLDRRYVRDPQDLIYATLTDEDVIDNAMGIFQQTYPNTVRIDYDNARTRQAKPEESAGVQGQAFPELIRALYLQMYGCEISEQEMAIMKQAAGEAGVWHETD